MVNEVVLPTVNEKKILNVHKSSFVSGVVYIAIELGLFETIGHSGKTFKEIMKNLKLSTRSINIMLSSVMHFELIEKHGNKYVLTQESKTYLLKGESSYLGDWFCSTCGDERNRSFSTMRKAILDGKSEICTGGSFEFLMNDVNEARRFAEVMDSKSKPASLFWPNTIDLQNKKSLLDIGGGVATHSISACRVWKNLKAIVFEIPIMCKVLEENLSKKNNDDTSDRIEISQGDMWEDDFPVADVHFYSDIFHNWSIEKCKFLAKKSWDFLPRGGMIILHEMLYDINRSGPGSVVGYDVAMFLHTEDGQQYTQEQLCNILIEAGFININFINTFGDWSIITGYKP